MCYTKSHKKTFYNERPLKTVDSSNGTITPDIVVRLELKFGLTSADATLSPSSSVRLIWAEIPTPCTLNEQVTLPFFVYTDLRIRYGSVNCDSANSIWPRPHGVEC